MKKLTKLLFLAAMTMLGAFICTVSASAASGGWKTVDGYTYYYRSNGSMKTGWLKLGSSHYYLMEEATETEEAETEEAESEQTEEQETDSAQTEAQETDSQNEVPVGSMVTGFCEIHGYMYYFSKNGVLQTGWKTISGDTYYFKKSGTAGTVGRMYTGQKKIGSYYFYFSEEGEMQTGWVTVNGSRYFYKKSGKTGVKGRAYTGWNKIGGYYYYFSKSGALQTSRWISSKYYVDSKGRRLTSTITPDGYVVNSKGVKKGKAKGWYKISGKYYYYKSGVKQTGWITVSKKKYYLDADGVRQTGWLTLETGTYYLNSSGVMQTGWTKIGSKRYYFNSKGIMQVSTTIDGVVLDENGVAQTARILLVAGHGQGDVGACATIDGTTYYEYKLTRELTSLIYNDLTSSDADIAVDMYDQDYNMYYVMYNYYYHGKKYGPIVSWADYDYVLEVHFNAAAYDTSGDGSYTGVDMLVHKSKSDTSIDTAILQAVKSTGISYHSGLCRRSDLFNMKRCYANGVSYGLLETCFIDDKDDVTFYNKNKKKIAQAVADAILDSFGY
ncbi:MAG: N-acetylmuramoyl-L-alanine amidase [Lachnospiraceae bacterium]|nr:N-acetylmuramoyl-L-alanine amidase [Lachnospiraceae bacterium]